MPKVIDAARVTTADTTVWRECPCCGHLAPLAPDALFCDACATRTTDRDRNGAWSR
jgi:hypothetical protein